MKLFVNAGFGLFIVLLMSVGCEKAPENDLDRIGWELERGNYSAAEKIANDYRSADSLSAEAIYCRALLNEYQGLEWDALIGYLDAAPRDAGFLPAMEKFTQLAIELNYFQNGHLMNRILMRKYPENYKYDLYAAGLFMRQNIFDSAQFYIDQAAAKTPESKMISLAKTDRTFRMGDEAEIKIALAELSELEFETEEQFNYLIDLYRYLNLGDSALHYARQWSQNNPDNIQLKLRLIKSLIDERRPNEALSLSRELTDRYDNCGPAYVSTAYAERMLGNYGDAEIVFNKFMEPYINTPPAYELKAKYYSFFNDTISAITHLKVAFDLADNLRYPDDYLSHLFVPLISGLLADLQLDDAHTRYLNFADVFTDLPDMNFFKAHLMYASGDVKDSAIIIVDDSVSLKWDDQEWLELAAGYYFRLRMFDEAKRLYQRLLEFPHYKPEYYSQLSKIYLKYNDYDTAVDLFKRLPFRLQNDIEFLETHLEVYQEKNDWDNAKSIAEVLYTRSGDYVPYLTALSEIYVELGLPDEGYDLLKDFVVRYPDESESYFLKAQFEHGQGMTDSAYDNLHKALALDTANGQALDLLGAWYLDQGQTDSAMACFNKVVDMKCHSGYAYYHLTKHYLETGENLKRAEGMAVYALHYYHDKRAAYLLIGKVYTAIEKYKLARLQFYNGTILFPKDAELNFYLGKTFVKLENSIEARKYLQTALQLDLQSPLKEEAESLMNEL
ncbi:MAG: tetratricopeptide repeat protein [candidate division Zixibacteria bacterium]